MEKKYLSIDEVARRFDVNVTTIYRLAQQGKLPAFKVGSIWRFEEKSLDDWIQQQMNSDEINP